jgi:hypothetical protein
VKFRNMMAAGALSLVAAAGLASPAYAAAQPAVSAKAAAVDKCSVHVNIEHPVARDYETLTVASTAAGTTVQVKIRYKTVSHTWKFTTAATKKATYRFNVGHPTVGWKVTLAGKVIAAPKGYKTGATCATSFVPK